MVRLLIASPLLLARSPLTKSVFSSLHIRGAGVQVDDALLRMGWDEADPAIAVVITVDPISTNVKGVRFETRGALPNVVKIKANDLWSGAEEGVEVSLKFEDLSVLRWATEGDVRNISAWLQEKDLSVTYMKGENKIQTTEKAKYGIGDFTIRFTVLPATVDQSLLYAGILPYSKAVLDGKVKVCGKTLEAATIPTVALKLFKSGNKWTNGHPIKLVPTEGPKDKFGLGVLPLIEIIGAGRPNFPDHGKVEEEMVTFLRATVGTNNTALSKIEALLTSADSFPKSASGTVPRDWPEYRGPIEEGVLDTEAATEAAEVDSMAGETAEEDISLLLDSVRKQSEPPAMMDAMERGSLTGTLARSQELTEGRGDMDVGSNAMMQAMMQQHNRTMNVMLSVIRDKTDGKEKDEPNGKRKSKEEPSMTPQEPVMFMDEAYRIEDNGHDTLDTKLRQKLRPINADPKEWWVKGAFNRVETPILGASLYTEHLMPGAVAEKTIVMAHDRLSHLEIKHYLTKNNNVLSEAKKKLKVTDDLAGEMHFGLQTHWLAATTVWEVVDAGLNYAAVEFMIRGWNYSPLAMIRCLHECRYFCGVSSSPKQQRALLEQFFNDCFKKNKSHAREGKHAVTFTDCRKVANQVLASNEVTCFTNYFSGDPYIGSNRDEVKKKNIRIAELEAEVKKLKAESGRGSYNNNSRSFGRAETAEDKRKRTCRDWNEGSCTKKGGRPGHCGFGPSSRKHGCANVLDKDSICWSTDHQEKNCPK